jgi:hypothetical protein
MKAFFLAVVVLNLAVFLWEYRSGAFAAPEAAVPENLETIVLVGESPVSDGSADKK